ncbi:MAG: DNA-binding protein Alba [Candidatus Undinarchaeales archaeon]|jgi:DNA-binding protein|nr:DNA-binding protein Alba [Candidatus Undinarchaeales archaeon]
MTEETPVKKSNENVVFVGSKPVMNYVLAVVTQFNSGHKDVHIEARGRAISRAVDVAEIVRKRFMNELKINNIDIGTEELKSKEDENVNVSTIKISLMN